MYVFKLLEIYFDNIFLDFLCLHQFGPKKSRQIKTIWNFLGKISAEFGLIIVDWRTGIQ